MIIRGHDLQEHNVEDYSFLNKRYGVTGYQLAIKKSFDTNEEILTDKTISKIESSVFEHTKILGAYFNPVHPDQNQIKVGIENFLFNMKLAEKYSIEYVGSETGSVLGSPWDYHPDNHLPETVELSTAAFKEIADRSKEIDVKIAIEPAYHHVISDVDTLITMTENIDDDRIVYILDVFNLLNSRPYEDYKVVLDNFLVKAGAKTKVIHLKDFIVTDDQVKQVKIGDGIVDFEYLISKVQDYTKEPLFVLEGTLEEDLLDASKLVTKYITN